VGCNLCVNVCPVDNCITLVELPVGTVDPRTTVPVRPYANWTTHPNNPAAHARAENLAPAK
jgi:dihydropyrimidine dehydrogenase (NAD+) subunit PreA